MCSPPPGRKSSVFSRRQQAGTRFSTKPCASKRSNCITRPTPGAVAPTRLCPAKRECRSDPTDKRSVSKWKSDSQRRMTTDNVHERNAPFTEEQRRAALIGRTVEGQLMNSASGFFVKWNWWSPDAIFVNEKVVLRDCAELGLLTNHKGAIAEVECTIEKLGPTYAQWEKQHPLTSKLIVKGSFKGCETPEEKEKFKTYLFSKRQAMSAGPAGAEETPISLAAATSSWRSDSKLTKVWSQESKDSQPKRHVPLAETSKSLSDPVRNINMYVPKRFRNRKPIDRSPVRPQGSAPNADPSDSFGTIIVISESDDASVQSFEG